MRGMREVGASVGGICPFEPNVVGPDFGSVKSRLLHVAESGPASSLFKPDWSRCTDDRMLDVGCCSKGFPCMLGCTVSW